MCISTIKDICKCYKTFTSHGEDCDRSVATTIAAV